MSEVDFEMSCQLLIFFCYSYNNLSDLFVFMGSNVPINKTMACFLDSSKKSLKISKGQSESVDRRTDNTMVKRTRTKGQTTIYKILHRKLKIEQHEPYLIPGVN